MKVLIADGSPMVTERLSLVMGEIPSVELLPPTATSKVMLESVSTG